MTINIGICGANGKMGKLIFAHSSNLKDIDNIYLYSRNIEGSNLADLCARSDVVIDFSSELCLINLLSEGINYKTKFIIGTTGISDDTYMKIKELSKTRAVLYSANMSFGVNLLQQVLSQISKILLAENFDAEILDLHHKDKIDSPSGTALMLGRSIAESCDLDFKKVVAINRMGKREQGSIGISSIRAGSIIGEHQVIFANYEEEITFSHKALSRDIFAKSAIKAALKIADKPAGFYDINMLFE